MKKGGNIQHSTFNAQRRSGGRTFGVRCSVFDASIFLTLVLLLALVSSGCRRDMFSQPSEKPLERSGFFRDNQMASRPIPAHTVARGQLDEDEAFYAGKIGTNLVTEFPMPITRQVLLRGQERFNIYCAPCHGRTGEGNGMIPQRGYPRPP